MAIAVSGLCPQWPDYVEISVNTSKCQLKTLDIEKIFLQVRDLGPLLHQTTVLSLFEHYFSIEAASAIGAKQLYICRILQIMKWSGSFEASKAFAVSFIDSKRSMSPSLPSFISR